MIYIMPASYPNRRFLPATLEFYGLLQLLLLVPFVQREFRTDQHIGGIFSKIPGAVVATWHCIPAGRPCPGAHPGASILWPDRWGRTYPGHEIDSGSQGLSTPERLCGSYPGPLFPDIAAMFAAIRSAPPPAPIGTISAHGIALQPGSGRPSSRACWGAILPISVVFAP